MRREEQKRITGIVETNKQTLLSLEIKRMVRGWMGSPVWVTGESHLPFPSSAPAAAAGSGLRAKGRDEVRRNGKSSPKKASLHGEMGGAETTGNLLDTPEGF